MFIAKCCLNFFLNMFIIIQYSTISNISVPLLFKAIRLRNHLFRQRLHRIEYYKEECTDVSWRFLLRPLGVAITKTNSWNAKIYIYIKPESKVYK